MQDARPKPTLAGTLAIMGGMPTLAAALVAWRLAGAVVGVLWFVVPTLLVAAMFAVECALRGDRQLTI